MKVRETANILVITHNVALPIHEHMSKEFSDRIYFMARRFGKIHIVSKQRKMNQHDRMSITDHPNIVVHRIPNSLISSNLSILTIAREMGADVIFADMIRHGASALLCKKQTGIPLITFVQGYEADLKSIRIKLKLGMKPNPGLLSEVYALHDRLVLRASDRILCVSHGLGDYARKMLPRRDHDKIQVIPHSLGYVKNVSRDAYRWADTLVSSLTTTTRRKVVPIIVIGLDSTKGTHIALNAHKYIVEREANAFMFLIARTVGSRYVKMARELELEANLKFLENLPRDKVIALLSKSSILLFPSFSEGFSWAAAEAMALGVPIVSYANKSIRDAQSKAAIISVQTTSPIDYARECLCLIKNEKLRSELVGKARTYVNPFLRFPEEKRLGMICNNISQVLSSRQRD